MKYNKMFQSIISPKVAKKRIYVSDDTKAGEFCQRVSHFYDSKVLLWIIICLGSLLRIVQYLANRSLWLDEAMLAVNIVYRPVAMLLQPLDYNQGAPLGFLLTEKLLVETFGDNEYALRLFPLVCGIIALFLFREVALYSLERKAVPLALFLFAISDRLIYYSSEIKQYSTDVAMALLLYLLTMNVQSRKLHASWIIIYGFAGAIAIWFSHPVVFILAGFGLSLTLVCWYNKDWSKIFRLFVVYSMWGLSFVTCYYISLRLLAHNKFLLDVWKSKFAPFPPTSFSEIKWFANAFIDVSKDPLGFLFPGIVVLTMLVGSIHMFSKKKKEFFVLISPLPFILVASALHKYPFCGRFLLFSVPFFLVLIVQGAEQIRGNNAHVTRAASMIVIILLIFHPLTVASSYLIKPHLTEEMKPVINYVKDQWRNGDQLYLYWSAQPAFEYYNWRYGLFEKSDYVVGVCSLDDWSRYFADFKKLCGEKRVWILFSRTWMLEESEGKQIFLAYLDTLGSQHDAFEAFNASVYLYDLSECEKTTAGVQRK